LTGATTCSARRTRPFSPNFPCSPAASPSTTPRRSARLRRVRGRDDPARPLAPGERHRRRDAGSALFPAGVAARVRRRKNSATPPTPSSKRSPSATPATSSPAPRPNSPAPHRGEADALRRLDINSPNLRAAAAWAENADPALHARLSLALGRLLQRRGFQSEAVAPIEAGIAAANTAADATLLARLLTERAGLHLDLAQPADARARAADALTLFQQHGNAAGEADAENLLGQAALDEKRYDDARAHFARALHLRETLGSRVEAAIVRNNLGLVEYFDPNGDRARAVEHLTEALRVRRAAGDRRGVAAALNNLGNLAFARQDWAEAERAFAETLENERALRHPFGVARALNNLGEVAEERGEYPKAARLYVAAEHLFREVKHDYAAYSAERLAALSARAGLTDAQIAALRAVLHNKPLDTVGSWATADEEPDAIL
jgi:tetratricopeptide (TPR) repeat protein